MKKITAYILFISLLSMLIVSCSDANENLGSNNDTQSNPQKETTAAVTEEVIEFVDPNVDYGGRTITMAAYKSDTYFWHAASYCDVFAEAENGDPINDALFTRNRAVEELLNVKIELYPVDISSRVIDAAVTKLILAGDDTVDVAFVMGAGLPNMLGKGDMCVDLNQIPTLDLTHSWWDQNSIEKLSILNKIFVVTGDISLYTQFSPLVLYVNKTLVDDYSLENPYDLVRSGKWVIDKMIEMIREVSHDVNGDGVMGTEDCYGISVEPTSPSYLLVSCNIQYTEKDANDIPQIIINNQRTIDVIEKLVPVFRDKTLSIFSDDHLSKYSNVFYDYMLPTFIDNRLLFNYNQILISMELRSMEADFGIVPSPKYDEAQDGHYMLTNNAWASFVLVPVTNKDYEFTGNVLDAMGYYSQQYVTPAFIDTTVRNKAIRDEDSAEMIELIHKSRTYDLAIYYNWGGVYALFSTMTKNNNVNFASEYAKIESKVLSELQTTIDLLSE